MLLLMKEYYILLHVSVLLQKKDYDRVMRALDSITSIREMTQVSTISLQQKNV